MPGHHALNTIVVVGEESDLAITDHGADWYWTVCALMALSTFTFMGLSYTKKKTHRLFHYITAGITLVASIAYYSMASGLGQTAVQAEFQRPNLPDVAAAGTRQIFWVRFVDYAITTPLILTNLFLTSSIPRPTMLATLLADELMVVCYLAGALTESSYKWGYFVFGLFAYFFVVYSLMWDGRRYASALGGAANKTFLTCAGLTVFAWFLYPIAWGVSVGGNLIHPDSEGVFFGILDIISKIVVGFLLVFGHRRIDPAELGLHIREHTTLPRHEKHGGQRDYRNHNDHNGHRKGILGHRNMGMRGNDRSRDYYDGPNKHHHDMSNHHNTTVGQHNNLNDHRDGWHDHRNTAIGRHDERNTGIGRNSDHNTAIGRNSEHNTAIGRNNEHNTAVGRNNEQNTAIGRENEDIGYNVNSAERRNRDSNLRDSTMNRNGEFGDYHNREDDYDNENPNYLEKGSRYNHHKTKGSGGGIFGLFRKKNHHDDRNQAYHRRDRSPDRDGYYGRDRSPVRDSYRREGRSRSREGYNAREHSPLRGDGYHTGRRSPNRGDYRRDDRSPYRRDGYNPDGRRSFANDGHRSFPEGRYPDGNRSSRWDEQQGDYRRSHPGGDYGGNDRRSNPTGEQNRDGHRSLPNLGENPRSTPIGEYNDDTRHQTLGGERRADNQASMGGADSNQQSIRPIPTGDHAALDRRPVPDAGGNRQALRPGVGNDGYGDNHNAMTGDGQRQDNRRLPGEYRQDERHASREFQGAQGTQGFQGTQGAQGAQGLNMNTPDAGPISGVEEARP